MIAVFLFLRRPTTAAPNNQPLFPLLGKEGTKG